MRGKGRGGDSPSADSHPMSEVMKNTLIAELHDLIDGAATQTLPRAANTLALPL